jgi:AcrR family transcriptional regulator
MTTQPAPTRTHRERLLDGMAAAVREKGFRGTTLADVVRHAGVSRRTFYEHFTDPVDCYLALIEEVDRRLLDGITEAMGAGGDLDDRIGAAVDVYLANFAADPEVHRSYWTEAEATGERGRLQTRRMREALGELLHALVEDQRRADPELLSVSPAAGVMLAAGIRELALRAEDRGEGPDEVRATSVEMLRRAIGLRP